MATAIRDECTSFKLWIKDGETKEQERRKDRHETRMRMMDYEMNEKVREDVAKRMAQKREKERGEWT